MNIHNIINQTSTIIIDVRETFEFSMGHADGALNIPLSILPYRLEEIKNFDAPVVLYCRSGNRSGMAAQYLKDRGMKEVYNGGSLEDVVYAKKKAA